MSAVRRATWGYRLAALVLILVMALLGGLRPLLRRAIDHDHHQCELRRIAFVLEEAPKADPLQVVPVRTNACVLVSTLISTLLIILRTRRIALVPVPVCRLKLPSRTTSLLLSD